VPSDVIWAAAIAGGVGVLGNAATLWATQLQRASHERTETKRIAADAARLKAEHEEAERQRRLTSYQSLMVVLAELDRAATWGTATDKEVDAMIARFLQLHADVLLIGTDAVGDALHPVDEGLNTVGAEMAHMQARDPGESVADAHATAYQRHRESLLAAQGALMSAMHEDVRRGYDAG
jgi:hypothetical protein